MNLPPTLSAHAANLEDILKALQRAATPASPADGVKGLLALPGLQPYQRHLIQRFAPVISKPSFDYISKAPSSWLPVGDRRKEIAGDIQLLIERHGPGLGLLVLHLQQVNAGHILTHAVLDGVTHDLARPTESLSGSAGEQVLWVPIREVRADFARLAELNVAKPRTLWNAPQISTHERDRSPCFYCSCAEINPAEVVVELDAGRHGLSRSYQLGFTFAPFGNPLSVVHFLAWDNAHRPLNMSRTPVTVSDLVKLTRELNLSIREYFTAAGIAAFPVLDGLFNGWAGNSIFHQHFQFFQPEHPLPVENAQHVHRTPLLRRDDLVIERLDWPVPIYRVNAEHALNTGLIGTDLASLWRYLGGARTVPYKHFGPDVALTDADRVSPHTHNFYVPGRDLGATLCLVLRDRERVDFHPSAGHVLNASLDHRAQPKTNLGVLEATGTLIADRRANFEQMHDWSPGDISAQVRAMTSAIAPNAGVVAGFEQALCGLFPE